MGPTHRGADQSQDAESEQRETAEDETIERERWGKDWRSFAPWTWTIREQSSRTPSTFNQVSALSRFNTTSPESTRLSGTRDRDTTKDSKSTGLPQYREWPIQCRGDGMCSALLHMADTSTEDSQGSYTQSRLLKRTFRDSSPDGKNY